MAQHWDDRDLSRVLTSAAHTVTESPRDLDPLLELTSGARVVLIGESTHGTQEFYRTRAELTKRLIVEQGFSAVAAEADWPDAYRVNRYVVGQGKDRSADAALADFRRFPSWMWRNRSVLEFVEWMREHNAERAPDRRIGFYGLDLYSLSSSIDAVLEYLSAVDPVAAQQARERYACFHQFGRDPQAYGHATALGHRPDCEREVVSQLVAMQQRRRALLQRDGIAAEDAYFEAEQNARVVMNAEEYYRAMFLGRVSSWNLRDSHMADILDALLGHLDSRFAPPKVVVWAHNSHVGDARATELGGIGEIDLGQLARERHPNDSVLIGQTTYRGSVTAASDWGGAAERKRVLPALPGSYEQLLHDTGLPVFVLPLRELGDVAEILREPRLTRAIGVVYRPETERQSHYFHARLADQFDAVIHVDQTQALVPLERESVWERGEAPETYPTGM